jgi:hypothetical protein
MLIQAAQISEKPIHWLWPGRLPIGCITILEGDPGLGKSQIECDLAAHVSTGKDWPDGGFCPQGEAIIANAEDPEEEVIVPRLRAAGADLRNIFIIVPSENEVLPFTIPDHVAQLEATIRDRNVKLVVFDPLEAFLSGSVDNYRNHHIRRALRSLELMAKRTGCSVVIVRHLNKDQGKSAIYRGSGSIGIIGAARSGLSVGIDPTDKTRCIMVPTKANWSKAKPGIAYRIVSHQYDHNGSVIKTSRIEWLGEVNITADDLLTVVEGQPKVGEDVAGFLKAALANGPKEFNEILRAAHKAGFTKAALFKAKEFIGVKAYPTGVDGNSGWTWELPDGSLADAAAGWTGSFQD